MPAKLSHLDSRGRANMVNVGNKNVSRRVAIACSKIFMKPKTLELILRDEAEEKAETKSQGGCLNCCKACRYYGSKKNI